MPFPCHCEADYLDLFQPKFRSTYSDTAMRWRCTRWCWTYFTSSGRHWAWTENLSIENLSLRVIWTDLEGGGKGLSWPILGLLQRLLTWVLESLAFLSSSWAQEEWDDAVNRGCGRLWRRLKPTPLFISNRNCHEFALFMLINNFGCSCWLITLFASYACILQRPNVTMWKWVFLLDCYKHHNFSILFH